MSSQPSSHIIMDSEYVLCKENGHFWPTKFVSRTSTSSNTTRRQAHSLQVEILWVGKKIKVKGQDVKILDESQIGHIVSTRVAQPNSSIQIDEELAYICSLIAAMDILQERVKLGQARASDDPEATTQPQKHEKKQDRRKSRNGKKYSKRRYKKREKPQSHLVHSVGEDSPDRVKAQVHTSISPNPSGSQTNLSQGSSMCPSFKLLAEDNHEKELKRKMVKSGVMFGGEGSSDDQQPNTQLQKEPEARASDFPEVTTHSQKEPQQRDRRKCQNPKMYSAGSRKKWRTPKSLLVHSGGEEALDRLKAQVQTSISPLASGSQTQSSQSSRVCPSFLLLSEDVHEKALKRKRLNSGEMLGQERASDDPEFTKQPQKKAQRRGRRKCSNLKKHSAGRCKKRRKSKSLLVHSGGEEASERVKAQVHTLISPVASTSQTKSSPSSNVCPSFLLLREVDHEKELKRKRVKSDGMLGQEGTSDDQESNMLQKEPEARASDVPKVNMHPQMEPQRRDRRKCPNAKKYSPGSGKKRRKRKSLLVHSGREEASDTVKAQVHTSISPVASGSQTKASPSSSVYPSFLLLSEDDHEKERKKKRVSSGSVCQHLASKVESLGTKDRGILPSQPPGFFARVQKALKGDVCGTRTKTLPVTCDSSTSSGNMEEPAQEAWKRGWEVKVTSSSAPKLGLLHSLTPGSRKRKLKVPEFEKRRQEPQPLVDPKVIQSTTGVKKGRSKKAAQAKSMVFPLEPGPITTGTMVWFKFQDHPFWPSVVKSVNHTEEMAKVVFIEENMCPDKRGIQVPLGRLKHLDCKEKEKLMKRARKVYQQSVDWCFSLISHYRDGLSRGSFTGSFLDYYAADISYPMRKDIEEGSLYLEFPKVNYADLGDCEEESCLGGKPLKKLLPDRMKAAWDRDNQKLMDFIVKERGADHHLLDIVKGRKESKWLSHLQQSGRYVPCVETYLEDEDQLDVVVKHLQEIYKDIDKNKLALRRDDKVSFVVEVLLPEAIICSIAALDGTDYKEAQVKYRKGPPIRSREKELFERKIIKRERKRGRPRLPAPYLCRETSQ